jgi:hypothetical protein
MIHLMIINTLKLQNLNTQVTHHQKMLNMQTLQSIHYQNSTMEDLNLCFLMYKVQSRDKALIQAKEDQ